MAVSLSVVVGRCIERIMKVVLSYRFGGGLVSVCDFGRGSGIDCCVTSDSKNPLAVGSKMMYCLRSDS